MINQAQFTWVHRRLRQAAGRPIDLFRVIPIITNRFSGQLPPADGGTLRALDPTNQLNQEESVQAYRPSVTFSFQVKCSVRRLRTRWTSTRNVSSNYSLPRARDVSSINRAAPRRSSEIWPHLPRKQLPPSIPPPDYSVPKTKFAATTINSSRPPALLSRGPRPFPPVQRPGAHTMRRPTV